MKNKERLSVFYKERHKENRKNSSWVQSERARGRTYWHELRHNAIMAYGGYVCACCGETEPLFLTLDHVNNNGAEHRRSLGYDNNGKGASSRTLKWLKDNDYPEGFQVLCMNCNMGKERNKGVCPHKSKTVNVNRVNSGKVHVLMGNMDNSEPSPNREGLTTISRIKRSEAHDT